MKIFPLIVVVTFFTGCASSLEVYDSQNKKTKGVPIHVPQLVAITSVTKYKISKGNEQYAHLCTKEEITKLDFYPLGERFYVNFAPAELGDGEFSIEFNDKGLLKSVTLNSKASGGAEQTNALLSTVLPFLAKPKAELSSTLIASDDTEAKSKAKYCLKTTTEIKSVKKVNIE